MFPVIAMQIFDLKNSIIPNKIFLVMILNMYLTSEWSESKSDFVLAVLQRGWIFHRLVWFFRVFMNGLQHPLVKNPQWSCKTTPFLLWLILGHVHLNANSVVEQRRFANNHRKHKVSDLLLLEVQLDHEQWVLIYPWVLTKHALNCPSFRKQSGVK